MICTETAPIMELRFLGQTYTSTNNPIPTIATARTGRFLGQNYKIRRSVQTFQPQLGLKKYRGVSY